MKKVFLVLYVIMLISGLTGIPYITEGILQRGWSGVNYGRVVFPFLMGGVFFWLFQSKS